MSYSLGKDVLFAQVNKLKTYKNLKNKQDNILYFVKETNEIYKGSKLYSSGNIISTYDRKCDFPKIGESIKLYISIASNSVFRWDADNERYVKLNDIKSNLEEIVDGHSIVIKDGKLLLRGFDTIDEEGLQLRTVRSKCTGQLRLEWFKPSASDSESLSSIVGQLVSDLDEIKKEVNGDEESHKDGILTRLESLETKSIDSIKLGDDYVINNTEDGVLAIPYATEKEPGVIKSSSKVNDITVNEDGSATVNLLEVSKLYIDPNTELVIDGGTSALSKTN